jgi:hypothetical protein
MTLAQSARAEDRPASRAASMVGGRYRTLLDLAIVAFAALALRLPAVGFGLPNMLHPDEPTNIAVGAQMAASGTWNPHFFSYPSLLFDVIAVADRAAKLFTGHLILPADLLSQGMGINRTTNPNIVLGLRLITVALSVGICLLVYLAIRRVTGRRWIAVGSGLLAATSPLLVTNGVFITPDTYSAFFTAATLVASLAVVRRGTRLDYVLAGVAVGFTAGSKYDVVSALPVVVAYLLREGRNSWRPRALVSLATAAVAAAAAFALTTPAVLFDSNSMFAGLKVELTHYSTGHAGEQGGALGFYLNSLVHDQAVLLPGAALAIVAACFGRYRKEVVVVGAFAVADFGLIASQTVRFDRNLLPLLPALILLTGFAAAWLAELAAERWSATAEPGKLAVVTAALAAVLVPAVIGAVGVRQTLAESPRTETVAWIEAHVPKGSSVVNEDYGPWINPGLYRVTQVSYVVSGPLPTTNSQAIIVTDKGSGRFIDNTKAYPNESATYQALLAHHCVAAKFTDGPWIEILTPCS